MFEESDYDYSDVPVAHRKNPYLSTSLCPKCLGIGQWRHGVNFEHQMICRKCWEVWTPNKIQDYRKWVTNKRSITILSQPYARVLIPEEDGGYSAFILEFPGCGSQGESVDEALKNLEEAAIGWIEAALDEGQDIPEPLIVNNNIWKIVQ